MQVEIRAYQHTDFDACRLLWAELTCHHREIYHDEAIGGEDPGQGFEAYLINPNRLGSWVAVAEGKVIGLTGLLLQQEGAEVEPLIVAARYRSQGVGTRLVQRAVQEARAAGVQFLSARPVARNVEAVRFFVAVGFDILGYIDLFQDLSSDPQREWLHGIEIHGQRLRY